MRKLVGWFLISMTIGLGIASGQSAWNQMQITYRTNCDGVPRTNWTLCGLFIITEHFQKPNGGPQALEGYTILDHGKGNTRLAFGTIGNIEFRGRGRTIEARSLQGGGVITGDGTIDHWSGLYLSRPIPISGAIGHIIRSDYITFDNGWSIRPDGSNLLLCDGSTCRAF